VLVVEYLAGGTLHDRLLRAGALPAAVVADLGAALASALDALHDQGILHRDLKPSNVGFTRTGVPKLLDFGLASLVGRAGDEPALVGGPAIFMSPEALAGAPPDAADDVWALALGMLQSLSGVHPFAARSAAEIRRRIFARPVTVFDEPSLQEWYFAKALHPELEQRPRSAGELMRELRTRISDIPTRN
jgi:serine/threonine-protein kinase